jgi:hypothetical protein
MYLMLKINLPINKKGLIKGLNILTNDLRIQMGLTNDNVKASMHVLSNHFGFFKEVNIFIDFLFSNIY